MGTFTVTIETDNAAFEGHNMSHEIARALRDLARSIEHEGQLLNWWTKGVRDANGNTVGKAEFKADEEEVRP